MGSLQLAAFSSILVLSYSHGLYDLEMRDYELALPFPAPKNDQTRATWKERTYLVQMRNFQNEFLFFSRPRNERVSIEICTRFPLFVARSFRSEESLLRSSRIGYTSSVLRALSSSGVNALTSFSSGTHAPRGHSQKRIYTTGHLEEVCGF